MDKEFKNYLDEQKQNNAYSSTVEAPLMSEFFGIGDNKKTKGWAVDLDFTKESVIDSIANIINAEKNPDESIKDPGKDDENFEKSIKNAIYEIIVELSNSAKKLKRVLGNFGKAFVGVQSTDDHTLSYFFLPARGENPEAFAERFIDQVGQNRKTAFLAKSLDATEKSFYKSAMDTKSIFFNPDNARDEIINDRFVIGVYDAIFKKVRETINANKLRKEKGNLINVYSVTYKVDNDLITNIAKETAEHNQSINDFYEKLVETLNKNIAGAINQIGEGSKDDYLGFIPLKTAGFNLYFKERSIAEDVANVLNQSDSNGVKEWKRYENKILNLDKTINIDAFRNSTFGIKVVGGLTEKILPGINDQVKVIQFTHVVDDDNIKRILKELDSTDTGEIKNALFKYFSTVYNKLIETHKEQLITIISEKKKLKFIFTSNVTDTGVASTIANLLYCDEGDVKHNVTALTKKEIEDFKDRKVDATNFEAIIIAAKEVLDAGKSEADKEKTRRQIIKINVETLGDYTVEAFLKLVNLGKWLPESKQPTFTSAMYESLMKKCKLLSEAEERDDEFSLMIKELREISDKSIKLVEIGGDRKPGVFVDRFATNLTNYIKTRFNRIASNVSEYLSIISPKNNNKSIEFIYSPKIEAKLNEIFADLKKTFGKIVSISTPENMETL